MRNNNTGGSASSMIRLAEKLSSLISSLVLPTSSSASKSADPFEDLKKLEVIMKHIRAIAVHLERRGVEGAIERHHLEKLKDVVYEVEDVADEYQYEVFCGKLRDGIQLGGNDYKRNREDEVNQITTSQLIVPVPSELAIRVKNIRQKLDDIIWRLRIAGEGLEQYGEQHGVGSVTSRTSLLHELIIYGRDEDRENIIKLLISDESNYKGVGSLAVLPLVGMGGMGKTTLAQLVYNDERVCNYFQLRAWVCAPEDFSVEILARNIIVSLTNRMCDSMEFDYLQKTLVDEVKGKKILIVLDDIWNVPSCWHLLKTLLTGTCFCKIIVITRSESVARKMQTGSAYWLTCLPLEYCWFLFKQLAFGFQDSNPNPWLLEIGKKIVKKCKGLPLAVKALGSLLRFEVHEENWRQILDSEIWELELRNNVALPALKISYDYLPSHLKQCFVVLSLFPKNYIISEDQIVQLWWSLGLVLPRGGNSLEEIGIGYLTEFVQRSMLQLTPQTSNQHFLTNKIERCFIMHDLINDLAQLVSGNAFSIIGSGVLSKLPYETRLETPWLLQVLDGMKFQGSKPNRFSYLTHLRCSISSTLIEALPDSIPNLKPLHYLDLANTGIESLPDSVRNLYRLQILDLTNCSIQKLPSGIANLKHLRCLILREILIEAWPDSVGNLKLLHYLDLANTRIESLPDSVYNLYNLQTLDLTNCPIQKLPSGIANLVRLEQLIFQQSLSVCMPCGKLTRLRTPSRFGVKKGIWLCELKDLVRHREELHITGLNNVANIKEADDANLENEMRLNVLILDWSIGPRCSHNADMEGTSNNSSNEQGLVANSEFHAELLERLRPNKNLKELHIHEYCGSRFPSWLDDTSFYLLAEISIKSVKGYCSSLPSLGQLPSLKNLTIESMEGVREVRREFCSLDGDKNGFRSLETLSFSDMKNWNHWSEVESDDFCSLQTLRIVDCPELIRLPNPLSSSITKLVIKDCDELSNIPTLPAISFLILTGQINEGIFDSLCLPMLKAIQVSDSRNVRTLDLDCMKFPMLEVLVVHGCRNLQYITGIDGLRSLKTIKISACQIIKFTLYQKFPSTLERLDIKRCPQLNKWKEIQEFTYYDQLYKNYNVSHEIIQELEVIESDTEDDDSE